MFKATVFCRYSPESKKWRITCINRKNKIDSIVNGLAWRSQFLQDEIAVTGTFKSNLKLGQFCKRPDQLVRIKEFRA